MNTTAAQNAATTDSLRALDARLREYAHDADLMTQCPSVLWQRITKEFVRRHGLATDTVQRKIMALHREGVLQWTTQG